MILLLQLLLPLLLLLVAVPEVGVTAGAGLGAADTEEHILLNSGNVTQVTWSILDGPCGKVT